MLKWSLVAIGLIGTSTLALSQSLPPTAPPLPTTPSVTNNPGPRSAAPLTPVRARNAPRGVSPGFRSATPIINGNPHIRVNRVGQVLTDELP